MKDLALDEIAPGTVAPGFAEKVLATIRTVDDPEHLWNRAAWFAGLAQKWNGHGQEKNEIKSAQMFCEIQLGQILGPNPGSPPGRSNPHADNSLPVQRIADFRRFFGHLESLVEAVRNGKRSRRSLLLLVDEIESAQRAPVEPDDLEIHRGLPFQESLAGIDPGTVTLILTDPPYPVEYLPVWSDLGKFAASALIPGGSLLAYCGQSILPDVFARLGEHLRYWWTIALLHNFGTAMIPGKWVSAGWKPMLWYVNEYRAGDFMLADRINGSPPRKTIPTGDDGDWAQGVEELAPLISGLTAPGDLIVDPFAGSGTVGLAALRYGRRFIGADLR